MKNKGFSMIELIIVIAIMVVLAGFLAPALIRYINKSRLSTDISNGREIASAIMSAITDESVKDNVVKHATPHPVSDMDGADFKKAVCDIFPVDALKGKSKKDADGNEFEKQIFYYTVDVEKNKVEIYYGDVTADYQIYPVTGSKLLKD